MSPEENDTKFSPLCQSNRARGQRLISSVAICCLAMNSSFHAALADDKFEAGISQIITRLGDKDSQARMAAFMDLHRWYRSRARATIPTLIELLKADPEEADHLAVRKALAEIGPIAEPALLELLRDDNALYRERAAKALWHMKSRRWAHSVIPDLITATKDKEKAVRVQAIHTLGAIGPESKAVVPAIAGALTDEDAEVRRAAAGALAGIGPAARSATPLLIDLLQHNDIPTRALAVFSLGRIGPDAQTATDKLIQLLKHRILREEASVALGRIGVSGPHVAALMEFLGHDEVRTRQLAALHLARIGPDSEPAVDALVASLQEPPMREFAIHALGRIGPRAKLAVPELINLLSNDSFVIRAGAAQALGRIGPAAKQSAPALKKASQDPNRLVRQHARGALEQVVRDDP